MERSDMYKPCLHEEERLSYGGSDRPMEPMNIDQCSTVRDAEDSQFVGVPVALARDVYMAEREDGCLPNMEVKIEVKGADGIVGKRKRGRPGRSQPKTPPLRKKKDEEDVCFICFDGGSLVLCDRRGCPKAYHPACIKRDESFFRSKAKWNCGWHMCIVCRKASHYMCYTCTYSLCKGCTKDAEYLCVRGNKGLCGICMRTIMLIENSAQGNKEKCEVDFDDKSSWEYLFKVYWIYLKGKLSLTLDELLRAKNPCKGSAAEGWKVATPNEICHLKDDKGSGSENSCIDIESNNVKNIKSKRQLTPLNKVDCLDRKTSCFEHGVSLPECTNWASNELLEFVALMKNGDTSLLSQFDVQALLLEYAKKNNLRDPRQKCQIVCDSRLENLFGRTRVGHFEMLKLLESHFLIKDDVPAKNTVRAGIIDTVASQVEANENYNNQLMVANDKRRRTRKKADVRVPQNNRDAYAAIDAHNINLLYLRRSLMESLIEDAEKFHDKVVGSIVRIRISSSDQKQEMYRLVQVVGTSKVSELYKIGTRTTDIVLEILNLDKKEFISIDEISNQEFSEEECQRLSQNIKFGLLKRLTVGEILDRAMTLQAVRINDLLEAEILRLNHLRDRASEKGQRKELRECVAKLQLLNSPEERLRRLSEVPEVHTDLNMDGSEMLVEKKQGDNIRSKYGSHNKREGETISLKSQSLELNDVGCRGQDIMATTHEQIGNMYTIKNQINPNDVVIGASSIVGVVRSEASGVAPDIPSLLLCTGMEQPFNDSTTAKLWHYQDPTGKVQGPFSMLQLFKWNASGHFPFDLRIWRINEKLDDSILLTDALSVKCSKNLSLPNYSPLLSLGDNSQVDGRNEIHSDSGSIKQSWNQKVDDSITQSSGKDESVRSNGLHSHSSCWSIPADGNHNEGQSENFERREESTKCEISCHDQPHVWPPLSSTAFSEKLNENLPGKQREGHGVEGISDGNHDSNRTSEGQSDSGHSYQKQSDSEENSGQSSGRNWRHPHVNSYSNSLVTTSAHVSVSNTSPHSLEIDLPSSTLVTSSSNCWDSATAFASVTKASPRNPEIDFSELPSHTSKPNNAESIGQSAGNKQSVSSNVPVQDAGPCWSTASSLVGCGTPLPEVTVEWRRSSTAPTNPSVEEWDSNLVSASSLKPAETVGDCAATPSSMSGQLTHSSPSRPVCNPSTWQAIIDESNEFSFDESVSDLLAEVEAMESLGGLESPISIMKCGEELTESSKTDCRSSAEVLSPMPDAVKSDALSSTGDLQLPTHSTAGKELQHQAEVHHHQRISGGHSSRISEVEVGTKNHSVSGNRWESGSEIPSTVPSPATWDMATDTTWRAELESTSGGWEASQGNANLGWCGIDQGNANMGWGVGQGMVQGNRSINSYNSIGTPNFWGGQTRYSSDRLSIPRDRAFHSNGSARDSGFGRGRTMWNKQPLHGVGNGGYYRPPPKGQRICKFFENGHCKKGASCDYLHHP